LKAKKKNKTIEALEAHALERRERFQTVELEKLDHHCVYDEPWYPGTYSHTLPGSKVRYLSLPEALPVGDVVETPTAIARDYLRATYGHGPGLRGIARDRIPRWIKRQPAFPLLAKPCAFEDGSYLDIYHCFWSIMLTIGWNPAYVPGEYLFAGSAPSDFPFPEHAVARDALVSCSLHNEMIQLFPPRPRAEKQFRFNPILNETLSVLIRDVLHALAWQAYRAGAVYWHTDGCVAPDQEAAGRIKRLIEDWGLTWHEDGRGPGFVRGVGAYSVGGKTTTRIAQAEHSFRRLRHLDYADWLQKHFSFFAANKHANTISSL
jgi:hypothetical protein